MGGDPGEEDSRPRRIAYWDFNEGTGTVLKDQSGNGHEGIIKGGRWVPGVEGKALDLAGTGYVKVPAAPSLKLESFTFSIWLWQTFQTAQQPLIEYSVPGQLSGAHFWVNTTGNSRILPGSVLGNLRPAVRGPHNDPFQYSARPGAALPGRWNHLVLTFDRDASVSRIYVNGVKEAEIETSEGYLASTEGDLYLGHRPLGSTDNAAGATLIGVIDEVEIFDGAVDSAWIAGKLPPEEGRVNLGIKTHYASPGDTLWVPVYLANFGTVTLESCQFNLDYDPDIIRILDIRLDSGLAVDWGLLDWNRDGRMPLPIALGGARHPLGYGEGELLRIRIHVNPDAEPGDYSSLEPRDVRFDEGKIIAATSVAGKIKVDKPPVLSGDVDGNGEVDLEDARLILRHAVGGLDLPDPEWPAFTVAVADVSGNGEVTGHDAALVFQYSLGQLARFPVDGPLPKVAAASSEGILMVGDPLPLENGDLRFGLEGRALEGLISGELALRIVGSGAKVAGVTSPLGGARLAHRFDPSTGRLDVAFSTNDAVRLWAAGLLEIDVKGAGGTPRVEILSAYMNEGGLRSAGIDSRPLSTRFEQLKPSLRPLEAGAAWIGGNLRVTLPEGRRARIDIHDLRGARVAGLDFDRAPAAATVPGNKLPRGMLWVRVRADGQARAFSLAHFGD